jgi:polar amino acid transport system substrate-binding protein/glutamate/aspartate transport system substrate-binding protein
MLRSFFIAIAALLLVVSGATAGTLDRIKDTGVMKIGYRTDAPPFSYKNSAGELAGYTLALCQGVAAHIEKQLKLKKLSLEYVPVTAENRFKMIEDGKADLLCGATTATLSRREIVDFSLPTFVDGASILIVRAGTTTEDALRNTVKDLSMTVQTVAVKDHKDGVAKLLSNDISAYFADRAILVYLTVGSGAADKLFLSNQQLTYEPYALGLPKGDGDFRLAVDRALSRIYRSGGIGTLFKETFGDNAQPTAELKALYRISALPN